MLYYKRAKFGANSERLTELAQLELLVEELESERAAIDPEDMDARPGPTDPDLHSTTTPRPRPAHKPLPDHLPRETVVHQSGETQRCTCEFCDSRRCQVPLH